MLTRCVENHVDKCAQYWPDEVGFIEDHGNFDVELASEKIEEFCTRREIHLTDVKGQSRKGMFPIIELFKDRLLIFKISIFNYDIEQSSI